MPFPQCSGVKYNTTVWHFLQSLLQAAVLDLFPPKLHFSGKIIVLWFFYCSPDPQEVPQLPSLWRFCFSSSSSLQRGAWPRSPLVTSAHILPPHLFLSPLSSNRWPSPAASFSPSSSPPDPLTSSCFSCWRRQLSKCLCERLLSFSLSPDQFPKMNIVACAKIHRMMGQMQKTPDGVIVFWSSGQESAYKGRLKSAYRCRGNAE